MIRKFESLEEIKALPGYVAKIPKGNYALAKALGYYRFKKKIHCSLSTCNQPHNFGYVIATLSNNVVAIGNVCGAEIFGEIFKVTTDAMSKEIRRQMLLASLEQRLKSLPAIRDRAGMLLNGAKDAVWLERAEISLRRACSNKVLAALYARVSDRDSRLEDTRERTKSDPPPLKGESPDYITEQVGTLRGLAALDSASLKSLIESNIVAQLPAYMTTTAGDIVDNKPLRNRFDEWHRNVEIYLKTAELRLREAERFYQTANLRLLAHFARDPTERAVLSRLRWNATSGVVEVEPVANAG